MSNYFGSSTWAAALPRTTVPALRVLAPLSHVVAVDAALAADSALGHTSSPGCVRPVGAEKRGELRVFATSAAVQVNAQVQDTDIRMPLGPPPWRPPE